MPLVEDAQELEPRADDPAAAGAAPPSSAADQLRADLLSALLNLGYHRQQAEKAIDATVTSNPNASLEHAVRTALRELMR